MNRLVTPAINLLAGLILAAMAPIAQAGLFGSLIGSVAGHVAAHQVNREIDGNAKNSQSTVLTPGLSGPLALDSNAGFSACPNLFPKNQPIDVAKVDKEWRAVGLCSNHFAVLYSPLSKTPLVVVEKLNSAILRDAKGEERTNQFYPDPRLASGQRAELSDFVGTGFDRGHMANAADQPDQQSMIQSFALSNMIPQDPDNNRTGAWAKAEKDTRKYALRATGDVYVFSGPMFLGKPSTIGHNKVWVPTHLFKLVYDANTGRSWAYIMEGTEMRLAPPVDYREFVKQTGWQLLGSAPG